MQGRKPSSPKVQDLSAGKLRVVDGGGSGGEPPSDDDDNAAPPAWMTDPNARAEWHRLLPELKQRKQYIGLFRSELARYCVAFGHYVQALERVTEAGSPVTLSSKKVQMLSMHYVVLNRSHETMRALAGDLGLNPVTQVRLAGLQLDLFDLPRATGTDGKPAGPGNPFGAFRR